MRRPNVVWVVIAPCRSHTLGLDVVRDNVIAVGKRQVTDSAVSLLRRDFLGEYFPQFCR
jgi:glycosylphosphatidylinositol transamidase (GPIT) subunit GPI8